MDSARVGLYESVLKSEGIPTVLRNWNAVSMTTEIPIPVMYPNICVLRDADAERAREIIAELERKKTDETTFEDWVCEGCGSTVEGQFDACWRCSAPRKED